VPVVIFAKQAAPLLGISPIDKSFKVLYNLKYDEKGETDYDES
jgi:hypothetical protein